MQFELTEEQKMVQQLAAEFAQKELPYEKVRQWDANKTFPAEVVKKLGELGFMGVAIPPEYGGAGFDAVSYVLAMIELAKYDPGTAVIMSVNNSLVCDPIYKFGNEEQKKKYLTPLASGQKLGCFALSEPEAGSDAAEQRTTAVRDGDYYILNGVKNFITNGPQADIAIVFAMTDKAKRHRGISAFIVETDTPGFSITHEEDKMGIRTSGTAEITLEDVRVPAENMLGREGDGFKVAMVTLDGGRIGIASQAVGIAEGAFEEAIKFAQERVAFGQNIINFQAIQWMLADMHARIEAAKLLTLKAAYLKDKGAKHTKESAVAKMYASETAVWVTNRAVQIHGGYGYIKDYKVEQLYRDAKITEIYEGTNEIQRLVIANQLKKEYQV